MGPGPSKPHYQKPESLAVSAPSLFHRDVTVEELQKNPLLTQRHQEDLYFMGLAKERPKDFSISQVYFEKLGPDVVIRLQTFDGPDQEGSSFSLTAQLEDEASLDYRECQMLHALLNAVRRGNQIVAERAEEQLQGALGPTASVAFTGTEAWVVPRARMESSGASKEGPDVVERMALNFGTDSNLAAIMLSYHTKQATYALRLVLGQEEYGLSIAECDALTTFFAFTSPGETLDHTCFQAACAVLQERFNDVELKELGAGMLGIVRPTCVKRTKPLDPYLQQALDAQIKRDKEAEAARAAGRSGLHYPDLELGAPLRSESSQAVVYRGYFKDQKVAVKVYREPEQLSEWKMELRGIKKAGPHPNVVAVLAEYETPLPCLVMPWLPGGTLHDYLVRRSLEVISGKACSLSVAPGERQKWLQCETCSLKGNNNVNEVFGGLCETCATLCHAGHTLKPMGVTVGSCACGGAHLVTECRCMTAEAAHPLDDASAVALILGVARGLHHLHAAGLVHRDVKSLNVMLDDKGIPVIIDLGMGQAWTTGVAEQARTLERKGSRMWLSPEMALTLQYSDKSDVFALGIVLWEILSGCFPYIHEKVVIEFAVATKGLRPNIADCGLRPPWLLHLMQRMWELEPRDRPSAAEVVRHLEAGGGGGGALSSPRTAFSRADRTGRGQLSPSQFGVALRALGHNTTPAELRVLFHAADTDESGGVNFKEFKDWLSILESSGMKAALTAGQGVAKRTVLRHDRDASKKEEVMKEESLVIDPSKLHLSWARAIRAANARTAHLQNPKIVVAICDDIQALLLPGKVPTSELRREMVEKVLKEPAPVSVDLTKVTNLVSKILAETAAEAAARNDPNQQLAKLEERRRRNREEMERLSK